MKDASAATIGYLNSMETELVREQARRLRKQLGEHILDIRLFGSKAEGDCHEESDIDVFILLHDQMFAQHEKRAFDICYDVQDDFAWFYVCSIIMSKSHFDELVGRERRLALDILNKGIPL